MYRSSSLFHFFDVYVFLTSSLSSIYLSSWLPLHRRCISLPPLNFFDVYVFYTASCSSMHVSSSLLTLFDVYFFLNASLSPMYMSCFLVSYRQCTCLHGVLKIEDIYFLHGLLYIFDVHVYADYYASSLCTQWTTYFSSLTSPSSMYMSYSLVPIFGLYVFIIPYVHLTIFLHYPPFVDISAVLDVLSLSTYIFHGPPLFCTHHRCTC